MPRNWNRAGFTESPGVIAVVAVLIAIGITPSLPSIDDAYILLNSADAVLAGGDSSYGSSPLTGVTSPAYALCLVVLRAINLPGILAVRVTTAASVVAFVGATWRLAGCVGATAWRRYALVAIGLVSGPVSVTLTNGLETGAATALALWCIVWTLERQPIKVALAAGVLPWVRPDLVPVAGVIVLASARSAGLPLWRGLLLAGAVGLPFAAWVRLDTGAWQPQTMSAKLVFFAEGCMPAAEKTLQAIEFLTMWTWRTTPIALGLAAALLDRLGRIGVAAAALSVAGYVWLLPGALTHNDYRYLTPLVVPWGLLGFARLLPMLHRVGGIAVAVWAIVCATQSWPWLRARAIEAHEFADAAQWVAANVPHDARILVHDAGAVSYYAPQPLTDLVGLKTPASIAVHRQLTWPSCGAERPLAIAEIARRADPQYLIVIADWDRIFDISGALKRAGWDLVPLRTPTRPIDRYTIYRMVLRERGIGPKTRGLEPSTSTMTSASADTAAQAPSAGGR